MRFSEIPKVTFENLEHLVEYKLLGSPPPQPHTHSFTMNGLVLLLSLLSLKVEKAFKHLCVKGIEKALYPLQRKETALVFSQPQVDLISSPRY